MSEESKTKEASRDVVTPKVDIFIKPVNEDKNRSGSKKVSDLDHPKIFVHEFLVDFLGALVPGILFTIAVTIALTPIIHAIVAAFSQSIEVSPMMASIRQFLESTKDTPNAIWIAVFIFGVLLSYTLGHLFYRRSPKKPDAKSFKLLSKELLQKTDFEKKYPGSDKEFEEKHHCSKKEHWLRCNFGCDNEEDCEFPYPYLDKYLETRGHKHLVNLVPWGKDASSTESRNSRSKTYINRLKIRLETHHPEYCRPIIRNEAHVRLAASMWHVGRLLWKCCIGAIGLLVLTMLVLHSLNFFPPDGKTPIWCFSWSIPAILPALIVTIFAFYCQRAIERFLLYQRLREAFYVLEVAYTCFRDDPQKLESPEINLR